EGAHLRKEPQTVVARHRDVGHDHVWPQDLELLQRVGGRRRRADVRAIVAEHRGEDGAGVVIVLDDEDVDARQRPAGILRWHSFEGEGAFWAAVAKYSPAFIARRGGHERGFGAANGL